MRFFLKVVEPLGVVFFFALGFVLLTYPLVFNFGEQFVGDTQHTQDLTYAWNAVNLRHQFATGEPIWQSQLLFFPDTVPLWRNANMPLPSAIAALWLNPYEGFNYILWVEYILTGLGMYYLARKLGANFGIALLASAFFTFSPPRSAHLWAGHINLLLTATVPFIFLVLLSIRKQLLAHRRVSVALVICLLALGVATLLSDFIVCFLIAYTILFCVMVWAWRRYMIASKLWVRLLVMAAILIGADQAVQHLNRAGFSNGEAFFWGADLLQFLTPSTQSWLYGDSFLASLPPSDEHSLFLGFTVVALFLASVIVVATRRVELGKFDLLLLGVLLLSILVALPAVNVGGYRIVRSPLSLLHYIPLWNENRCPTRMSQLAWFIMPLFSLGVFSRLRWIQQLNLALQVLIVATVGILALGEYLPSPYKLYYLDNKAVYRAYLGNQTTSALVLPFGIKDGARTWGIWEPEAYIYQYNHNVRLMGGYISRIPDDVWHSQQTDSLVQQLVELQVQPASLTVDSATCIRWGASFLSKYPIQSVVIPPSWRQSAAVGFLYACLRTHIGHQEDRQGYAIWKLR